MIVDESQEQRDMELAALTGLGVEDVRGLQIAGPDSIRIHDGNGAVKTPEEFESLYSSYRHLNLPGYVRTLMYTSIHRRHDELLKLLRETRNARGLDFGSGVATHAIAMAENGNEVSLLDVEGPLLDFARKRIARRGLQAKSYGHKDRLPEKYFDVAICTDVLEHVYDPLGELERIAASLKTGGLLHLQVSRMQKDTSGHFKSTQKKWRRKGPRLVRRLFDTVKPTIYRKK